MPQPVGGDDVGQRAAVAPMINGTTGEFMRHMLRHIGAGSPPLSRLRLIAGAMADGGKSAERGVREHCHVAQMLAPRLGINPAVAEHVGLTFEFWNGKGMPGELEADAIPMDCRVVAVARGAEVFLRLGGWELARETLTRRRGGAYDPAVTDVFLAWGERWLQDVQEQTTWDAVIAAEPARALTIAAVAPGRTAPGGPNGPSDGALRFRTSATRGATVIPSTRRNEGAHDVRQGGDADDRDAASR